MDAAIVAAIALATNLLYLRCSSGDYFFPDSSTYLLPARNLLAGFGFVNRTGAAETIRTPGYPLLLAAMGVRILPIILLQHFLNAAIAAGSYLCARRITGTRLAAFSAGLLVALDTPSIHYANKILSETLFAGALLLVFLVLLSLPVRDRESVRVGTQAGNRWIARVLVAGLGAGSLVLIRPVAILAFLVFAVWMLLCRIPLRWVLLFGVTALVIPGAWALRNLRETGVFTVSSIGGTNLLIFRAAGAIVLEEGTTDFRTDLLRVQTALLADAEAEIEDNLGIPDAEELPHAVLSRQFSRIAVRTLREHPKGLLLLTLRGLAINLFDSRSEAMEKVSSLPQSLVRFAIRTGTGAIALLALAGIISLWIGHRRAEATLIALTVAYFLLISAGAESESRFRVPVIPEEAIAAGAGLQMLVVMTQNRGAARATPRL